MTIARRQFLAAGLGSIGLFATPDRKRQLLRAAPSSEKHFQRKYSLHVERMPLTDVIQQLVDKEQVPVSLRTSKGSVYKNITITLNVHDIDLNSLLNLLRTCIFVENHFLIDEQGHIAFHDYEIESKDRIEVTYPLASLGPLAQNYAEIAQALTLIQFLSWKPRDPDGGQVTAMNANGLTIVQCRSTHQKIADVLQKIQSSFLKRPIPLTDIDRTRERIRKSLFKMVSTSSEIQTVRDFLSKTLEKEKISWMIDEETFQFESTRFHLDSSISVDPKKATLFAKLRSMLQPFNGGFWIENESLTIRHQSMVENLFSYRVYDIRRKLSSAVNSAMVAQRLQELEIQRTQRQVELLVAPVGPLLVVGHHEEGHEAIANFLKQR